jgi:hypothetical protein
VHPDAYVSFDLVKMFNAQIVQKQQFTNFTTMVLAFLRERPDTLKTSRPMFRVPVDVQTVLYRMVVEVRPPSLPSDRAQASSTASSQATTCLR